jgi:hypothetical protein
MFFPRYHGVDAGDLEMKRPKALSIPWPRGRPQIFLDPMTEHPYCADYIHVDPAKLETMPRIKA